jgi:hypothetical protein
MSARNQSQQRQQSSVVRLVEAPSMSTPSVVMLLSLTLLLAMPRMAASGGLPTSPEAWEWLTDSTIPDKDRHPDLNDAEWNSWTKEVVVQSGGMMGVGISIVMGLLMSVLTIFFCCRCRSHNRIDAEISMGQGQHYDVKHLAARARSHRRMLVGGVVLSVLGTGALAGYAFMTTTESQDTLGNIVDGTDVFMTEFQLSLCAVDGGEDCVAGSVGDYLGVIQSSVERTLDSSVDWLDNLGELVPPLDLAASNLTELEQALNSTEAALLAVNASMLAMETTLTNSNYLRFGLDFELPLIAQEDVESLGSNRESVRDGRGSIADSRREVYDQLVAPDSPIAILKYQLDNVPGNEEASAPEDLRQTAVGALTDLLDFFQGWTKDVYDVQYGTLDGLWTRAMDDFVDGVALGTAIIAFLPAAVLLLLSIFATMCGSAKPLYMDMMFIFLVQGLYCLSAGAYLLVATVNQDVCDAHPEIVRNVFTDPISSLTPETQSNVAVGTAVMNILNCHGQRGDPPTADNNLVSIMGIQDMFDIEEQLAQSGEAITSQRSTLEDQKQVVRDALAPLQGVDPFGTDVREQFDLDASQQSVSDVLGRLPPSDFDRDDAGQRALFEAEYLSDGASGFVWQNATSGLPLYSAVLGDINGILLGMEDAHSFTTAGAPFSFLIGALPLNYTGAGELLKADTFCGAASDFDDADNDMTTESGGGFLIYEYGGQDDDLCANITIFDAYTQIIDAFDELNANFTQDALRLDGHLLFLDGNLTALADSQFAMAASLNSVNTSLGALLPGMDRLLTEMDALVVQLLDINNDVMSADAYTNCGYIGDFYRDVYLGEVCGDFQTYVVAVGGVQLAVAIIMFFTFLIIGCYAPAMRRKYNSVIPGTGEESEDQEYVLNVKKPKAQNTPLLGPDGFN